MTEKYGVFVLLETIDPPGVERDGAIYVFDSEEEADAFILESLISAGVIERKGWAFIADNETFSTAQEAIEAVQWHFGTTEFFHSYPIHATTVTRPA